MNPLRFDSNSGTSLLRELNDGILSASLRIARHGRPISVTFWLRHGGGVRVRSQMHDVAERIEIGVLTFDLVQAPLDDEGQVDVAPGFRSRVLVSKLLVEESGCCAESGVVLEGTDGAKITVVAGANPYSLAVRGLVDQPHIYEPEYSEDRYIVLPLAE